MVYPNPEEFIPERWLDGSPGREEREKWFWAWGSGSRVCIGQYLAMESKLFYTFRPIRKCLPIFTSVVMRYATAAIFTNFTCSVVDDEGFGHDGTFVTGGPGDRLILKFEEVGPEDIS